MQIVYLLINIELLGHELDFDSEVGSQLFEFIKRVAAAECEGKQNPLCVTMTWDLPSPLRAMESADIA